MLVLGLVPGPGAAQQRDLVVEVGASQVRPPSGVVGDAARFVVGGVRGVWLSRDGSGLVASFLGGRSTDSASGGDFLSGQLDASAWRALGNGWWAGLRSRTLGYWVAAPYPYRAGAVEVGPSIRLTRRSVSLRVDGIAGIGRSRTEVWTAPTRSPGDLTGRHTGHRGGRGDPGAPAGDSTVMVILSDLWRVGASGEVLIPVGGAVAGAAGGIHRTAGGTFRSGGLRILRGGGRWIAALGVDVWWTPFGRETTGGLTLSVPVGGRWRLRGFVGRTEPDPLTLATSSGGGGGVLVGRRVAGRAPDAPARAPLYRKVADTPAGARIRIAVEPPAGASRVEVLGDFTLWEPVAMTSEGSRWTVEIEVPAGVHHFGFLVDGTWYVPDDAPDVVPDEWGRRSATMVVEG